MLISNVIDHVRNRDYMSGVERDRNRVKSTGEVFTPTPLVREILDQLPQELFEDPSKTFLDNSCGDGQFLGEVLIRKLEHVAVNECVTPEQFEQALSSIYGVDLMIDNVDECRRRLLCGSKNPKHIEIVEQNIYRADGLKFSYNFEPMSNTRRERENALRRKAFRKAEKDKKDKKAQEFKDRATKLLGLAEPKTKSKTKKQPVDQ